MKKRTYTTEDLNKLGIRVDFNQPYTMETKYGTVLLYKTYRKPIRGDKEVELKPYPNVCKHPYGKDVIYWNYAIQPCQTSYQKYYNRNKKYEEYPSQMPVSRLYYIAYYGEIEGTYDVDHIDNNKFNNRIENLQAITRKANIAKRMLPTHEEWVEMIRKYNKKEN